MTDFFCTRTNSRNPYGPLETILWFPEAVVSREMGDRRTVQDSEWWYVKKNSKQVGLTDWSGRKWFSLKHCWATVEWFCFSRKQSAHFTWVLLEWKEVQGYKGGVDGIYLTYDYICLIHFYLHTSWHPLPSPRLRNWGLLWATHPLRNWASSSKC